MGSWYTRLHLELRDGFNSQVGGGQISHGFDIYLYQAP